jgi:HEAT repeat protein
VEFRESIKAAIPKIIDLLKRNVDNVRSTAADILATFSHHGKVSKFLICTLLIYS